MTHSMDTIGKGRTYGEMKRDAFNRTEWTALLKLRYCFDRKDDDSVKSCGYTCIWPQEMFFVGFC